MEETIGGVEARIAAIEANFADPEFYKDHANDPVAWRENRRASRRRTIALRPLGGTRGDQGRGSLVLLHTKIEC